MLRRMLACLLLSVLVANVAQAQWPQARWGSLAVCARCGASGGSVTWSHGYSTPNQARQSVVDRLRSNDHHTHKILVTTSDRYIVVAFAASGSIGYEHSNSLDYAMDVAMRDCRRHWGTPERFVIIDNRESRTDWGIVN